MQIVGDAIIGAFLVFLGYKIFLKFGIWVEKRSEKIANETKKEITHGR